MAYVVSIPFFLIRSTNCHKIGYAPRRYKPVNGYSHRGTVSLLVSKVQTDIVGNRHLKRLSSIGL